MQCTVCGTENEPDSRFCGGCGRSTPQVVATPVARPAGAPMSYGPPAMPGAVPPTPAPGMLPPVRRPSTDFNSVSPTAARPAPTPVPLARAPTAEESPPAKRVRSKAAPDDRLARGARPAAHATEPTSQAWGVVAIVLVLDLALAGTGAVLLAKGLSARRTTDRSEQIAPPPAARSSDATAPEPRAPAAPVTSPAVPPPTPRGAPIPDSATAAPTTALASSATAPPAAAQAAPAADAPASPAAQAAPTGTATSSAPRDQATVTATAPVAPSSARRGGKRPGEPRGATDAGPPRPLDPYASEPARGPSTAAEVEAEAKRSRGAFDRCKPKGEPVHGTIAISFHVAGDGNVRDVAIADNTTTSPELARCLVGVIAGWKLSPHRASVLAFVRQFPYP